MVNQAYLVDLQYLVKMFPVLNDGIKNVRRVLNELRDHLVTQGRFEKIP